MCQAVFVRLVTQDGREHSVSQQKLEKLQWSLPQFKAGPRNHATGLVRLRAISATVH